MAEIEVKLKGIAQLKAELRELKSELANATDPQEVQRLAEAAGEVADKIKDVNEQANAFASGSPFERSANALGEVKNALFSLDFEKASQRAQLFNQSILALKPDVFSNAIKGLTGTVFNLGKAFMSIGAALLTNPIFLIAAAIVGIVTIIGVLLNKLGLLKPILNAIGEAFKFVKSVIDSVVQSIKDFLDWLGLTSFAAEEAANRQAKAQDKVAAAHEKKRKKVTTAYDQEIALAQIAGEETFDLERKKQEAIIETSRQEYKALEAKRDALKVAGILTAEQSKQLNDAMKSLREGIQEARFEITKINKREDVKQKNQDEDETKRQAQVAKERREKAVAEAKRRAEEEAKAILDAAKAAQAARDEFLNTLEGIETAFYNRSKSQRELELEAVEDHFFELLEKARQYGEDTTILEEERRLRLQDINARFDAEEKEKADKLAEEERKRKEAEDKEKEESQKAAAKARVDALVTIEQSLYAGVASLGEVFIQDSKKLEQFQKAQALVQIGIDTAKAISSLVAASQANPANGVTGGLAGVAQFASGLAQILTNIAKAKQILSNPNASASGGGGGGAAASTSTTPAIPQVNLFGQGNNMNTFGQSQSVEQGGTMVVQAVVSETEITSTQNKINKMKLNAEL